MLRALDRDASFRHVQGGHQLVDPRTREAYLYLLERLLLGGAAPRPPAADLRAHLRLAGPDLADLLATPATSTAAARAR